MDTAATRDTTDTSGVQNPPGYRGMERDTTIFPDSGGTAGDTGTAVDTRTAAGTTGIGRVDTSARADGADTGGRRRTPEPSRIRQPGRQALIPAQRPPMIPSAKTPTGCTARPAPDSTQ